jgi:ABC-2 type transport system permease protein
LQAGEEHGIVVFDQRFGELWSIYRKQERVHHWAALISPLIAVRSVSMAMAGTDLTHLRGFTEAAERLRRVLNKEMNENLAYGSRAGQYYYFQETNLWTQVPEFDYRPPSASAALRPQLLPFLLLLGWFGAAAFAASRAASCVRAV